MSPCGHFVARVADRIRCGEGNDAGSALIEFVGASVILLIPLLYLLLSVFDVQRSSFAATEAAREAGRAFATAPSSAVGVQRAHDAAQVAFEDQGIDEPPMVRFLVAGARCGTDHEVEPSLVPGAAYTICVARQVGLPYADKGFLGHAVPVRITVVGRYALFVDRFRESA
jgi:hypothetical protein